MNYLDSFITVAEDSPTDRAIIPQPKGSKKTVALIQYEMLAGHPYEFTQEDVLFRTHAQHKELLAGVSKTQEKKMREQFFAKPQPCLRTSPLARTYGWGFHFDRTGKVALYPVESKEYDRFAKNVSKVLKAMSARRA